MPRKNPEAVHGPGEGRHPSAPSPRTHPCLSDLCAKHSGEILRVEAGLWTFAHVDGVEPTNNAAERLLRHAVSWRKISGGTKSEAGSRFVDRVMTVAATCRQQKRDVLEYLSSCIKANRHGQPSPSLLPATRERIEVV